MENTKAQHRRNRVDLFFSSAYLIIIYAVLFFCGFISNQTALFLSFGATICALSLVFSSSINGLYSFAVMLPLVFQNTFEWTRVNVATMIMSGIVILACLIAHVITNKDKIKSIKFGKLIWGLFFALIALFVAGVGKIGYLNNAYYILAFVCAAFLYILAVNTKNDIVSKSIIAFATVLNFEMSLTGIGISWMPIITLLANSVAICLCFKLAKNNYANSFYYGFMSIILLLFSILFSSNIVVIGASTAAYILSLIYFVIKEKKKSLAIIPSFVIGAVVLIVAMHLTNYQAIAELQNMVKTYSFEGNNILLESMKNYITFGIGFEYAFASNVVYVISAVGVVGAVLCLLLFMQITKITFARTTYNRAFVIIGYVVIVGATIFANINSPVLVAILLSFFAINELENIENAENPLFDDVKWIEKRQKYAKAEENESTFYQKYAKRAIDIVLSFAGLVILSPLFLVISILSAIILKGNPFFAQYRPGKDGKVFKLFKFRSMTNKKDANGNLLPDKDRITKYGKILRKLSIDELPQLVNILIGDMSIVGPRPRLVKDMMFYDEDVMKAYSVRPGLTGRSQVSGGRSESSWESIFEEDLKYYKNISLFGDIKILFQTVKAVLSPSSANGGAETSQREYYYADYLLKTGKITQEQYDMGLKKSSQVIESKGFVKYTKELH